MAELWMTVIIKTILLIQLITLNNHNKIDVFRVDGCVFVDHQKVCHYATHYGTTERSK